MTTDYTKTLFTLTEGIGRLSAGQEATERAFRRTDRRIEKNTDAVAALQRELTELKAELKTKTPIAEQEITGALESLERQRWRELARRGLPVGGAGLAGAFLMKLIDLIVAALTKAG